MPEAIFHNNLNIRDFVAETEPKIPGLPFKPEKEFTHALLTEAIAAIERLKDKFTGSTDTYRNCSALVKFFPQNRSTLGLTVEVEDRLVERAAVLRDQQRAFEIMLLTLSLIELFPGDDHDQLTSDHDFEIIKTFSPDTTPAATIMSYYWYAYQLRPQWLASMPLPLEMANRLSEYSSLLLDDVVKTEKNPFPQTAEHLARCRVVLSTVNQDRPLITDQWRLFYDWFRRGVEQRGEFRMAQAAYNLKILSAKKVRLTDAGLEFSRESGELDSSSSSLPLERNY